MLVPGRLLADITRALPDKPVHLTADATRATLTCGRAHYTLPLLPLDEFRLIALFCGFQVTSGWVRPGSGRA
jgi:DNA polymerase III sliding clamp (beta) subunit (PCNA family)